MPLTANSVEFAHPPSVFLAEVDPWLVGAIMSGMQNNGGRANERSEFAYRGENPPSC